jgi:hypothetical protein
MPVYTAEEQAAVDTLSARILVPSMNPCVYAGWYSLLTEMAVYAVREGRWRRDTCPLCAPPPAG